MDFRILVQPSSWDKIKQICRNHFNGTEYGILDHSPERELEEEIESCLNLKIRQDNYTAQLADLFIEDEPQKTKNMRARGFSTVRIYYIYEARLKNPELIRMILENSKRYSEADLQDMAWQDSRQGGRGRANAVLALPLHELKDRYSSIPGGTNRGSVHFNEHLFDGNVWAVIGKGQRKI